MEAEAAGLANDVEGVVVDEATGAVIGLADVMGSTARGKH